MRFAVIAALLLVTTVVGSDRLATAAAPTAVPCAASHPHTIARTATSRAYLRGRVVWACERGQRRGVRLGHQHFSCYGSSGCGGVEHVALAGHAVAFFDFFVDTAYGDATFTVKRRDLRTGRLTFARDHGEIGGDVARDVRLVLDASGGLAYSFTLGPPPWTGEVWRIGRCGAARLDGGAAVDAGSLVRDGQDVVWTSAGTRMTARLC